MVDGSIRAHALKKKIMRSVDSLPYPFPWCSSIYCLSLSKHRHYYRIRRHCVESSLASCSLFLPIPIVCTWFPSEGMAWWTTHWASTTPIFSWAGCSVEETKQKGPAQQNMYEWFIAAWKLRKSSLAEDRFTQYLHAPPKGKVHTPPMDQVILWNTVSKH